MQAGWAWATDARTLVDCAKAGTAIAATARIRMDFIAGLSGQAFSRESTPHAHKDASPHNRGPRLAFRFSGAGAKIGGRPPPFPPIGRAARVADHDAWHH